MHQNPRQPLLNIRQRPPHIANEKTAQNTVKDRLYRKLPKSVRLRLYSAYENPKTGIVTTEDRGYGVTYVSSGTGYIWINLALEMFQPLLRDDLSEAERCVVNFGVRRMWLVADSDRVACQFKAAQCLVHETAVSASIFQLMGMSESLNKG